MKLRPYGQEIKRTFEEAGCRDFGGVDDDALIPAARWLRRVASRLEERANKA